MLIGSAEDSKRTMLSSGGVEGKSAFQDMESEFMPTANDENRESPVDARKRCWSPVALALALAAALGGCKREAKIEQESVRPVKVVVVGEAARARILT